MSRSHHSPAHRASIVTFFLPSCPGLPRDLAWLAGEVASGRLDPQISWRGSWSDAAPAIEALLERPARQVRPRTSKDTEAAAAAT